MLNRKVTALVLTAAIGLSALSVSAATAEEKDELGRWDVQPGQVGMTAPGFKPLEEPKQEEPVQTEQAPAAAESPEFVFEPVSDPEGVLSFVNVEARVREGSLNVRMMEENIQKIEAVDYERLGQDLREGLSAIADAQWAMKAMGGSINIPIFDENGAIAQNPSIGDMAGNAALNGALQGIAAMNGSQASKSLQSQYDTLKDTYEKFKEGELQQQAADGVRQLQDTQKNVIMMAQSLYIQMLEGQAGLDALDRAVESLERQIAELELRYEMGQISALTLQQAKAGLTTLLSNRATVAMGVETGMMNLKNLVGEEADAPLTLAPIPELDGEYLAAMDLQRDMAQAKEKSFTLYNAQKTLDDAREVYKDAGKAYSFDTKEYQYVQAQHTWNAAQYTYDSAVQTFETSFRTLYAQVKDYSQVLTAARTALAVEEAEYAAAQLKFEQGTISQNALLTAENELDTARDKVSTAERNLFTSYNNYRWAVDHGILN